MKITFTATLILILLPDSTAKGRTGTHRHGNWNPARLRGGQEAGTTAWHPRSVGARDGISRHRDGTITGEYRASDSVHWATGAASMQETERVSGTCGDGVVGNGLCSMPGECCSTFGWCGVGPEYCGGTTVPVAAPVGGAPVGGAPESPVGVAPEAPVGVAPEAPVGYPPVLGRPSAPIASGTCGNGDVGNGICSTPQECCSPFGWCGVGPEYCGGTTEPVPTGPLPTPTAPTAPVQAPSVIPPTAPTRPTAPVASDTCGNGIVGNGICSTPQECCSPFGWCGVGPEYCGGTTEPVPTGPLPTPTAPTAPVQAPPTVITPTAPSSVTSIQFPDYADGDCSGAENVMTVNVGYYQSWSIFRECNPVAPSAIDVAGNGYTHLIYSFASINANFQMEPYGGRSDSEVPQYQAFNDLKQTNPGLKTLIAVGGWSFNDPGETQTRFSETASTPENRAAFAASCVQFCQEHGFDGVDLDWEYPGDPDRGGQGADMANFGLLVDAIRSAFNEAPVSLELTMAVPVFQGKLTVGYDLPALAKGLDFFNLMAYDIHGDWDNPKVIGANTDLPAIFDAVRYFLDAGVEPSKMALGLAAYGRSYVLADPSCTTSGCAFSGPGSGGCTGTAGFMPYFSIDEVIQNGSYKSIRYNPDSATMELVVNDNEFITFDNPDTMQIKYDFASKACFRGIMWWAIDMK